MDEMPGNLAQGLTAVGGALATLFICNAGLHMAGGPSALTAVATAVSLIGLTSLMRHKGTPPQD